MPAIADQVATIEHDLAVAQTTVDSLRSENAQLKTALAALNVDHTALQEKHSDALALVDETRMHADGVATAALTMLKVSRRQIVQGPSEGTKALQAMVLALDVQQTTNDAIAAAIEGEKTDVRPELPEAEQGFSPEMQDALRQDAEKLSQMTGEDHSVEFIHEGAVLGGDIPNTDRLRAHMPTSNEDAHADPLPIFLKPRAVPDANVLG